MYKFGQNLVHGYLFAVVALHDEAVVSDVVHCDVDDHTPGLT